MKKVFLRLFIIGLVFVAFQFKPVEKAYNTVKAVIETPGLINKDSLTIKSRVKFTGD